MNMILRKWCRMYRIEWKLIRCTCMSWMKCCLYIQSTVMESDWGISCEFFRYFLNKNSIFHRNELKMSEIQQFFSGDSTKTHIWVFLPSKTRFFLEKIGFISEIIFEKWIFEVFPNKVQFSINFDRSRICLG